ncbi:apolipoprotein N-acyltransferase [Silvimonas sp. JCM 19000]
MRLSLRPFVLPAALAAVGALSVLSFAPINAFPLMWLALAALSWSIGQAGSAKRALALGYAWGLGFFCANIYWIYISLHTFGGMPALMAAGCVFLLSMYMALFPALATWAARRWIGHRVWRMTLGLPALFTLTEWLRGWLFTGFPWANVGNSQVPMTPLVGYLPVVGVYGAGGLLLLSLGALMAMRGWERWATGLGVWALGGLLMLMQWTYPVGDPVSVSLAQGNIPQDEKWAEAHYLDNLRTYLNLTAQAQGDIVILPETAIPSFMSDTPTWYLERLVKVVQPRTLVTGVPLSGPHAEEYYNSVTVLTNPKLPMYSKRHLVPFGEFVPLPWLFGWMYHYLNMPLSGFTSGAAEQAPFVIGKHTRLAPDVCYEDAFGREIIKALPDATLLVNVSNLAWFDGSWAAWQQTQMSQARAIETGRYMLRATNTGVTAIIDERGHVLSQLPQNSRGVLEGKAQNFAGTTPYVVWGDWMTLSLSGLLLLCAWLFGRKQ